VPAGFDCGTVTTSQPTNDGADGTQSGGNQAGSASTGGVTGDSSSGGPVGQGLVCPDWQTVLDQHNQARAARGAAPLTWSDQLAADAVAWSQQCNTDSFGYSHSSGAFDGSHGENLCESLTLR
jgi:uncharacterized protein YkwD